MITIKYFGMLAEHTQCNEEQLDTNTFSLSELIQSIREKHKLNQLSFQVALNQKLIHDFAETRLQTHDEIALLPPFAGG